MSHDLKICPECREEYTNVPTTCVECETPLVYLDELEPDPEPEAFPPVTELECVRVGPLAWTRALSEALHAAVIAHRVEPDTRSEAEGGIDARRFDSADLFGTWVLPDKLSAAREVDQLVLGGIDIDPSQSEEASEEERCPACEAALPVDALECPDCGLGFG